MAKSKKAQHLVKILGFSKIYDTKIIEKINFPI
jgi:hypothetical protein